MFLFRLARLLGKSVFEIKNSMSHTEINKWALYLSREPDNSVEIQMSLLTQIAVNMMSSKSKSTVEDFLITRYKEHKEVTVETIVEDRPTSDQVKLAFGAFIYK